jgi:hypothetical protein
VRLLYFYASRIIFGEFLSLQLLRYWQNVKLQMLQIVVNVLYGQHNSLRMSSNPKVFWFSHLLIETWILLDIILWLAVPEKREFQAETRMLLDIVAKSLYSEKEVCLSHTNNVLVSNYHWLYRFLYENWFPMPLMHWKSFATCP